MADATPRRVYVAGPMTGFPELNFPAFHAVAAHLRSEGFEVVNPAELNDGEKSWADCMRTDIAQLVTCDAVVTLPGWPASKGASLEVEIARSLGMRIVHGGGPA